MPLTFDVSSPANVQLLDDPDVHRRVVDLANARALASGLVQLPEPALALAAQSQVSLAQWQTAFQDQRDRGTCYAFAACAAMEAAYRRQFGVVVDLSEHYVFHINKVMALLEDWVNSPSQVENNSTLQGFQGSSDMVDKLARFGAVNEVDAPYLTDVQMVAIRNAMPAAGNLMTQPQNDAFEFNDAVVPLVAHQRGRYQIESFAALPANPSIEQVKTVLQAGYEVVVDVKNHCYLVVGYDDALRVFQVKNSWGENTFIYESYDTPTLGPILGGRYITRMRPIAGPQPSAAWMGHWYIDHDGWKGELTIRRFTDLRRSDGEPTKLGDYYRDGGRYDVNGRVSDDGLTMEFWIADTTNRTEPGSEVGQRFFARFCAGDYDNAAGTTQFDGVDYGVRLSRRPFSHSAIGGFDVRRWIDAWAITDHGHAEVLRITNVDPVEGRYARGDLTYDITGHVDPHHSHILRLKVPFDAVDQTSYDLFHHTREDGAVSGYSRGPGTMVGIQADRYIEAYYPPFAPPGPGVMVSFIYAVPANGILRWFRHDGARHGAFDWKGPRPVGQGWSGLPTVIPGGGDVIYGVTAEGELFWYEHLGFNTGAGLQDHGSWRGPVTVNHGFGDYAHVFSGGNGVLYGITGDGRLIWHRHHAVASGLPVEVAGSWSGPKEVGVGWNALSNVFGGGDGIIYGVNGQGELVWYNHLGHRDGLGHNDAGGWSATSGRPVGVGWSAFTTLFSSGNGVIYGIQPDGVLRWYRHLGHQTGAGLEAAGSWEGGVDVGWGWGGLDTVFALIPRDPDPVH